MPVLLQIFIILFLSIFVQAGILNFLNRYVFCIEESNYRKSFNIIFFSVVILMVGVWNLYFIEDVSIKFFLMYAFFSFAFLFFHFGLKIAFRTTLFENLGILCLQALCVVGFLFLLGFHKMEFLSVQGSSMAPTYTNRTLLLMRKDFTTLTRSDVVIFRSEQTEEEGHEFIYLKRIVGLPHEKVEIRGDGYFYVNDRVLEEPYLSDENQKNTLTDFTKLETEWVLGEDEYFVLGDNRMGSLDSRDFGPVKKEDVLGKFWKLVYAME